MFRHRPPMSSLPASHGENRGSSPLGSANDFKQLPYLMGLWSKIGPISHRAMGEWVNTSFGTRGSQVQILPLRPAFFTIEAVTGNDMGNETVAQRKHFAPIDRCRSRRLHFVERRKFQLDCHVRFTPKSGHWNSVAKCPLCAKSGGAPYRCS